MLNGFEIENGILKKYRGAEADIVIPDGVKEIFWGAFDGNKGLVSVVVPGSVTNIGEMAFHNCTSLTSVSLTEGLIRIGEGAFYDCISLASIIIPKSVKELGGAFTGCSSLTSVAIPDGVTDIMPGTFSECSSLTSVAIPNSVTVIWDWAFFGCKSLTSIVIPGSVTKIKDSAFSDCENLLSITIPDSVTAICDDVFDRCGSLTVICREGSYAHEYCVDNRLTFIFDYQYEAFGGVLPEGFEKLSTPFQADEGSPYIFVSYSHKDRERVFGIIKTLYESGWRLWYDEGLTVGVGYDETLHEHVKGCAAFLLFVSDNSRDSEYINIYELRWAAKYFKPIIKCILDEGIDQEIYKGTVSAAVTSESIEPALEKADGLIKVGPRTAKGISVVVDPTSRTAAGGFAYCLYAESSASPAHAIMLEAKNSGCALYDAVEIGEDNEKLDRCACLIVFLDKAFLSDEHLTGILTKEYEYGGNIAVCQIEDIDTGDLPQKLEGLYKLHWLNYSHGITYDLNTKLAQYLEMRGCRDASVMPGFEYIKTESGVVITKYTGRDSILSISRTVGNMPVVEIGAKAFINCIRLKEVVIPDSVVKIGKMAFGSCYNLTSVVIPQSVKTIDEEAFIKCTSLISIDIPDGVTSIAPGVFGECTSLTSITIPGSVSVISENAFVRCTGLASVTVPGSVERIEDSAFKKCTGLVEAVILQGVTEIGGRVFEGCTALASVKLPDSLTAMGAFAFSGCSNLSSVVIPPGMRRIEDYVFVKCSDLTSVKIPYGVTEIGRGAFEGCKSLASIDLPDSVTGIGFAAFEKCTALHSIEIPLGVTETESHTFNNCTSLTSISIPDSVTVIGALAFYGCTNLTSVTIPDSVTVIEERAFSKCNGLADSSGFIIVRDVLYSYIGNDAGIVIPDSVRIIEIEAFYSCDNLVSALIPDSVKKVLHWAFWDFFSLTSVTVLGRWTDIEYGAFYYCPKLTVTCPKRSRVWDRCVDDGIPVQPAESSFGSGLFGRLFGKK